MLNWNKMTNACVCARALETKRLIVIVCLLVIYNQLFSSALFASLFSDVCCLHFVWNISDVSINCTFKFHCFVQSSWCISLSANQSNKNWATRIENSLNRFAQSDCTLNEMESNISKFYVISWLWWFGWVFGAIIIANCMRDVLIPLVEYEMLLSFL